MTPECDGMPAIVTLLTDFGTLDGFVGAMKGVILTRAPDALVVDLTHDVPPQDVWAGAWALREACGMFPEGSIHVAVVDPGVGTARRPILVEHRGHLFVGPDNGLLSLVAPGGIARHLDREDLFRADISHTFHGRDIFASVAGHLAAGVAPADCGSPVEEWLGLELPTPILVADGVQGCVLHVDRFGNLVSNINADEVVGRSGWVDVDGGPARVPLYTTFADVAPGQWVAYRGSSGFLEIAVRDGDAAGTLDGVSRNRRVTLCRG